MCKCVTFPSSPPFLARLVQEITVYRLGINSGALFWLGAYVYPKRIEPVEGAANSNPRADGNPQKPEVTAVARRRRSGTQFDQFSFHSEGVWVWVVTVPFPPAASMYHLGPEVAPE